MHPARPPVLQGAAVPLHPCSVPAAQLFPHGQPAITCLLATGRVPCAHAGVLPAVFRPRWQQVLWRELLEVL